MSTDIIGSGWSFPPNIGAQGGLALTNRRNEIDQAIWIILSTSIGERVMRATFGSRLHELFFEPLDTRTMAQAEAYVSEALAMWEPRIEVLRVVAEPDHDNSVMQITVEYAVKQTNDTRTLVYPFYTIPEEE